MKQSIYSQGLDVVVRAPCVRLEVGYTVLRSLRKFLVEKQEIAPIHNRFQVAVQRIQESPNYEVASDPEVPYGFFSGRFIIGERTQIHGGIFVTVLPHEALVVDEKYGLLTRAYDDILVNYVRKHGSKRPDTEEFLPYLLSDVRSRLKFRPEECEKLIANEKVPADRKTALDLFIHRGIGNARHQVLLAGYLFERFRNRGILDGSFEFDSKLNENNADRERITFSLPSGSVVVFDPHNAAN